MKRKNNLKAEPIKELLEKSLKKLNTKPKTLSVVMDDDLMDWLNTMSKENNVRVSDLVRECIRICKASYD